MTWTWVEVALIVGAVWVLGVLMTISNHLAEISRQLRNLHDDHRQEMIVLGDKIDDTGARLELGIDRLRPGREWDDLPPR